MTHRRDTLVSGLDLLRMETSESERGNSDGLDAKIKEGIDLITFDLQRTDMRA